MKEGKSPAFLKKTFFSEEKKAKDFLKGQGSKKARSKTLLPQKPPGTDGRLFPFARGSVFISSLGSKNARYGPGVFRFERPFARRGLPPAANKPRPLPRWKESL